MKNFNDENLQKMYDKHKNDSLAHNMKLDNISKDIKNLESFLDENFGGLQFTMKIEEFNERLIWSDHRLKYFDSDSAFCVKPLIETKVDIRLRVVRQLPKFLEFCIENSKQIWKRKL